MTIGEQAEDTTGGGASLVGTVVGRRLVALTDDEEAAILDSVLERGIDQGWFLRPADADLVAGTALAHDEILREVSSRSGKARPTAEDPYLDFNYRVEPVVGEEPGFLISTQKCDLLQTIRKEPLVELIRARRTTDRDELTGIRKASPRYFSIQDAGDSAWIADLRSHAYMPKDVLRTIDGHHVMDVDRRRNFCLRLGDRYERRPVPTALVDSLQRPLIEFLAEATNVKHAAHFQDWRILLGRPKVVVLAIMAADVDRRVGEDAFEALQGSMPEDFRNLLDEDDSRAVLFEELTFAEWFNSTSLDLDQVTYSKGARSDPGHAKRVR